MSLILYQCLPTNRGSVAQGLSLFLSAGLKSQHVTSIAWLAKATGADVAGLEVGSKTLEFRPNRGPGDLLERNIKIRAESAAASSMLIFQAVLPFLVFAGNESSEPIELEISGGTNVSFSLSYEYLDQVLLPTLEKWFGIRIERKLRARGWSMGSATRGLAWFKIHPLDAGKTLRVKDNRVLGTEPSEFEVKEIHVSIIAPTALHDDLHASLRADLDRLFPQAAFHLVLKEDSKHESRIYVLLVAISETLRWGRDMLYARKRKGKTTKQLGEEISQAVAGDLYRQIRRGGAVDEYLQDQLVIFQALSEGRSSFSGTRLLEEEVDEVNKRLEEVHLDQDWSKDRVKGPLGDPDTDSRHTTTARWVTAEVLDPDISWFRNGNVCEGIGLVSGRTSVGGAANVTGHA